MLDDHDVDSAVFASSLGGGGCIFSLVCLVVVIAIASALSQNFDECGRRRCPNGQMPKLVNNACLCVTEAKP